MTVTVAMPYYGCPDLVERAVRSVLAQTHRDLRLVVVGDGEEPPLASVRDDRLVVYTLPENRGTYFALQLILEASPDQWHAPHGADDWSAPDHLEQLLAVGRSAVASGTVWFHRAGPDQDRPTIDGPTKRGWHVGIFDADRLRALGGYDPSERLSQDTLVLALLDMTGGYVRHVGPQPTYHRWKWGGSLTGSPDTGISPVSAPRAAARARNAATREHCRQLRRPERIRAYRDSLVPADLRAELDHHVAVLRESLREAVAA